MSARAGSRARSRPRSPIVSRRSLAEARAAGVREPQGRTRVTVPAVYAATPRVLITGWLDGVSLSTLLDGRMDLLPEGWRELSPGDAADLAARLLGHAIYAPAACTGWMHADLHPGNFLLLPGGRLGMLDFGAVAAVPGGIPAPFGQLAAAVLAGDGPMAVRLARQVGALAPEPELDPRLVVELLHPHRRHGGRRRASPTRAPWLRGLMAHFTEPRFAPALRNLTPPREYALVWRATLSAAGLFAQLGATVPTRGFQLAYSPGFRNSVRGGRLPSSARAGTGRTALVDAPRGEATPGGVCSSHPSVAADPLGRWYPAQGQGDQSRGQGDSTTRVRAKRSSGPGPQELPPQAAQVARPGRAGGRCAARRRWRRRPGRPRAGPAVAGTRAGVWSPAGPADAASRTRAVARAGCRGPGRRVVGVQLDQQGDLRGGLPHERQEGEQLVRESGQGQQPVMVTGQVSQLVSQHGGHLIAVQGVQRGRGDDHGRVGARHAVGGRLGVPRPARRPGPDPGRPTRRAAWVCRSACRLTARRWTAAAVAVRPATRDEGEAEPGTGRPPAWRSCRGAGVHTRRSAG